MKIEDHTRNIKESLEVIKESIQKGLQERQRNIGFNVSVASAEIFDFENKEEILKLLNEIETKRNLLCYGKPQPIKLLESFLQNFNALKALFEEGGLKWN